MNQGTRRGSSQEKKNQRSKISRYWPFYRERESIHLNAKEWGEDNVAEDDEVDLVEEAAEHEDNEDQVHDGEHSQRHSLTKGVRWNFLLMKLHL